MLSAVMLSVANAESPGTIKIFWISFILRKYCLNSYGFYWCDANFGVNYANICVS
jgi:hypothetical protein